MTDSASPPGRLAAAILAGGRARRFGGRNKALVDVGGEPILTRQLRALARVSDDVVIVANDTDPYRPFGVRVVPDRHPGAGPLAGIEAALADRRARVVVLACDMPHVVADVLSLLAASAAGADIVAPVVKGRVQPLCAIYGPRVLPVARRRIASGRLRASALVEEAETEGLRARRVGEPELRRVDPELRTFANLNAPADAERLR